MSYNDVYTYLMQVRLIDKRIWLAQIEHDEMQSCLLPSAITYDKDVVQTSPEDKMSSIAGKVIDMEKKIIRLKNRKAQLIITIKSQISEIEDEDQRIVLSAFFLCRQPMRQIAEYTNRSISGVYTIRRKAIQSMRVILAKESV